MTVRYTDPFGAPWRFQWMRLIFIWKGGIFQCFWLEWLIAMFICAMALTIAYYTTKNRDVDSEWPDRLETLAEVVAFIGRRFQAAIGMMLGFYTSTMYGRWTTVRNREGDALKAINDIATRIAWKIRIEESSSDDENVDINVSSNMMNNGSNINGQSTSVRNNAGINGATSISHNGKDNHQNNSNQFSEDSRRIRIKLVRLINLSHAIVVGELYENRKNEFSSLEQIRASGLATEKEYNFLKRQSSDFKYIAPLVWFQDNIRCLIKDKTDFFDTGSLGFQFANPIIDLRSALGDLYRFADEPVPLIYRQMVNVAVRLYMLMLLLDGIFFEMRKDDDIGKLTIGSFWEILKYSFEYFLFVGWLTVSDAMGNPFRCWPDQLDWVDFVKRISKSSLLVALQYGDSCNEMRVSPMEDEQNNALFVNMCKQWQIQTHQDINNKERKRNQNHNGIQNIIPTLEEETRKKWTGF